jgi:superfamily II DNA or RNA helicase
MRKFQAGQILVLSNVDLFGEGVDVPAIEAVIDCAPTLSLGRCMQRWGRALRPDAGKTHAIILDHAGNSSFFVCIICFSDFHD